MTGRQARAACSSNRRRETGQSHRFPSGDVEALTHRRGMPPTEHESFRHVADVDGMQPHRPPADGPELVAQHRPKEPEQMKIDRTVDEARPDDDGWKTIFPEVTHG